MKSIKLLTIIPLYIINNVEAPPFFFQNKCINTIIIFIQMRRNVCS